MNTQANQIIDAIGGSSATARLCEVTVGAVSQWRVHGIPRMQLKFLKLARPDLFSGDAKQETESREVA